MAPSDQPIDVTISGDGAVVVTGEVDVATIGPLAEQIAAALSKAADTFVVDLSGIGFMDSSGIRLLLDTSERCAAQGIELELRAPSPAVVRLLDITGLTTKFRIT